MKPRCFYFKGFKLKVKTNIFVVTFVNVQLHFVNMFYKLTT